MFQMFSNCICRLLSTLSTFPENFSSKKFLEHNFLRILTAANMRNKPFSAISSKMVTWADLISHNETVVITMDNCCTFWRSSTPEITHNWPVFVDLYFFYSSLCHQCHHSRDFFLEGELRLAQVPITPWIPPIFLTILLCMPEIILC